MAKIHRGCGGTLQTKKGVSVCRKCLYSPNMDPEDQPRDNMTGASGCLMAMVLIPVLLLKKVIHRGRS